MAVARRTYFVPTTGEKGIWGASFAALIRTIGVCTAGGAYVIYKLGMSRHSPNQQWLYVRTDLWEDDGTQLEGDEATANLRIQRSRVLPFLDDGSGEGGHGHGHDDGAHGHH